jgi:hypothetical protein
MTLSLVKAGVVAAAMVVASVSVASAAQYAIVTQDSFLRLNHSNSAPIVNDVEEGDVVQLLSKWGSWWKVKVPGPDGWIRSYKLEFDYEDNPQKPGVQFCFNGPFGYICVNQPV